MNITTTSFPFRRYTEFSVAVEAGATADATRLHDELLADLYAVQSHMARLDAAAAAFRREQALYNDKQEQLQAAIVQAEADIAARKASLEEARAELARQQEYEAVKERVVAVPARSATRAEMAAVEREIADLTAQGEALEGAMARRRTQFAAILHAIEQVHAGMEAEEGGEEGEAPGSEEGEAPAGGAEPMAVG